MMNYPKPPFPKQRQLMPGFTNKMRPIPDHGERPFKGIFCRDISEKRARRKFAADAT
jgi:hypothetical protein